MRFAIKRPASGVKGGFRSRRTDPVTLGFLSLVFTNLNTAGRKMSVVIIREAMQMVRSFPILAMPRWGENERALKKRGLAVLVSSMLPFGGGSMQRKRPESLQKAMAR